MIGMRIIAVALAGAALAGVGCGEDWEAETYPTSGRLTIDGEGAEGAVVQLHAIGEGADIRESRPWGVVGPDGTFTLGTYGKGDGAPSGDYAVTITWPPDPSLPSTADRLGGRFATPERSTLRVTIEEGENSLPPIALTDVVVDPDQGFRAPGGPPMPGLTPGGGR